MSSAGEDQIPVFPIQRINVDWNDFIDDEHGGRVHTKRDLCSDFSGYTMHKIMVPEGLDPAFFITRIG